MKKPEKFEHGQIISYQVVTGVSAEDLEELVMESIAEGAEPIGGVATNELGQMFQAVILRHP